jgi:hypothetical protein
VEQALLISRGTSQPHVKSLLPSTVAIASMGTPHLGSRKADWAAPLTALSNLFRQTNKDIVAVLEPGSEMLSNLQQEFHTMLEDRRRNEGKWLEIFCFYEELAYLGIGDIVPRQSAILPEYPNASIHQNHSDMTKFSGATDPGYVRVRGQLWLWVDAIDKRRGVEQAQEHVRHEMSHISEETRPPEHLIQTPQQTDRDKTACEPVRNTSTTASPSSGGGPIFMGNVTAGRDFKYNQGVI